MRRFRTPSPATGMSAVALFVALGGIGYAAVEGNIRSVEIVDNTIKSKDIKDAAIQNKDIAKEEIEADRIADAAIASAEIENNTIGLRDIAASAEEDLQGQRGPTGETGPTGLTGTSGPAGPAGRSALEPLRSGESVYGVAAVQGQGPNLWTGVTLPIPAPTPVDSFHVVIANNDTLSGDGCTGTAADPVSSPGFVCLYTHLAVNTTSGYGWGARCSCGDATATGDGSRFGFMVQANGPAAQLVTANWVWVYTAP